MVPGEYLRKPYGRVVVPESDGTFRAEIVEFPGCIAVGDTAADALANLEEVATTWLEAVLEKGQSVPEPIEAANYSGKFLLRLAKSLHKRLAHAAARDGVSLNRLIENCLAEAIGEKERAFASVSPQPVASLNFQFSIGAPYAEKLAPRLTTMGTRLLPALKELEREDA